MSGEPLTVALTVEQCWQPVPGGSGTYVRELTTALAGRDDVRVIGLAARHAEQGLPGGRLAVPVRSSGLPRIGLYEAWSRLRRPSAEHICGPVDVVHASTWALPGHGAPLVATVHDLAFLREPAHFTARGNRFFRRALDLVVAEAAAVVVPSRATADDLVRYGLDEARVHVVPHGVRAGAVAVGEVEGWRSRNGIGERYVLWCGTLEPRKNLPRLVRAFVQARAQGMDAELVLAGPQGWGAASDDVGRALRALPDGVVHLTGRLDDHELQVAYHGATAFAFPSLWEGFGMPVLEAMAHGVPVLTSVGTSMAEFAEGAGELADPLDVDALATGLLAVTGDDRPDRAAVAAQAGRFTWEQSAAAHVRAYRAALAGGR
ncbi:MAG: glycosyltransferase family 4 protein [Actinobacteria bacterium]|nr:glycosyltransferase family 4 protein [Actinomycetota bacterium]MCG2799843.1 glycosyltransferase family 4 protein [Cellulomonas sp.]